MTEQNTQAVVLQQPEKSMFIVKVEQDTDWFAIGALLTSFFVTIWIVRKSTKQQIESNKNLIAEQNIMLIAQLKITNKSKDLSDFRNSVANYYYWGMKVNIESISNIDEYYNIHDDENRGIALKESVRIRVNELNALISQMLVYLDYAQVRHNTVRDELFNVMNASLGVYTSIGTNFENSHQKINVFNESFGKTQGSLNTLISEEVNAIYEEKAA